MAAAAVPSTPQRPLPGAFLNTPAPAQPIQGSTIFAQENARLKQTAVEKPQETSNPVQKSEPTPEARAARVINETLAVEQSFPELETYVTQGTSGDYELSTSPAWHPFQKMKMYDIPMKILEQANNTGLSMQMGLFPPLNHAYIMLDNALYLWDYTQSNPEIIGYEELTQTIDAVELVPPKPGVFIPDIKHMIVICTASEMTLLGVATQLTPTGVQTIALYNTKMSIPIRGIDVRNISASSRTGRIFFTGGITNDIYEFDYRQEEGWFQGKCNRICHTKTSFNFVPVDVKAVSQFFGSKANTNLIYRMVVDDSRNLLYTLSTTNEIRVWLIKDSLEHGMLRPFASLLQNAGHFHSGSELLTGRDVRIVSISAIPAIQARKVAIMATTNTGCRLYLSLTRDYGSQADAQHPPNNMNILQIRFPPRDPNPMTAPSQPGQTAMARYTSQPSQGGSIDTSSKYLTPLRDAQRYSPGYWLAWQTHPQNQRSDRLFCTAPDSALLKGPRDNQQLNGVRYSEFGQWIDLPAKIEQLLPLTPAFGATAEPRGFGNELAVQFDQTSSEYAIITTAGIQTIRRRRLVDVFASVMKYGSLDDKGTEGEISRFVRIYGRGETAATSLAVACGQGLDVAESRVANVTDADVIEKARRVFIEQGGKPEYNANAVVDQTAAPVDNVRPSPRHEGIVLYVSRLVRSIWKAKIIKTDATPGAKLGSTISASKLVSVQRDLTSLNEFLSKNSSFIEGLTGPQALSRAGSHQEEIALQGEARAMRSLLKLIGNVIEGISFVITLFEENVDEIVALLSDENKVQAKELTFETLFVEGSGRALAKDLTKAIVNRNIANGSNVDSVTERLRRKCGSFCSAEDVTIFKAQELVKRAQETGAETDMARNYLNESQRLFTKVAGNLNDEYLQTLAGEYINTEFFAGLCKLCLTVASQRDRGNSALSWINDGMPQPDYRQAAYEQRYKCYQQIFNTIQNLEEAVARTPDIATRHPTQWRRIGEAYQIINEADDQVFLTCLYDQYMENGNETRILNTQNQFVEQYLQKRSETSRTHADLLWRYYAHHNANLESASTQYDIAKSHFEGLTLEERIGYLSRARALASTRQNVILDVQKNKQKLLRGISDLLELASVQDEMLQRIRYEKRIDESIHPQVVAELSGSILDVGTLFNRYADACSYHDFCLQLYQVADHRNPADIQKTWRDLIEQTDANPPEEMQSWEAVGEEIRRMGRKLNNSSATFPIPFLLPQLEKYASSLGRPSNSNNRADATQAVSLPPRTWAVDIFLDLQVPHETLLPVLEQMFYSNEPAFAGPKKRILAEQMVYLMESWFKASERSGERFLFGSDENLSMVQECSATLSRQGLLQDHWRSRAETLQASIMRLLQ